MIKKIVLSFLLLGSISSYACELPRGEVLSIGCTYRCGFLYRLRLKMAALTLGYRTKITTLDNKLSLEKSLSQVDAVLIPGGADIDPKYYLDAVTPELKDYTLDNLHLVNFSVEGLKRDAFEFSLTKKYITDEQYKDLPLLGICRGMQMMSVAQGIPLYLDIKTELGINNRMNRFDRIFLADDSHSLMQTIYNRNSVKGFKLHHQGIRVPYFREHQSDYPKARVTSVSNDDLIAESLELIHRPALGVQYHPEKSFPRVSRPVFSWFLTRACEYKNLRMNQHE